MGGSFPAHFFLFIHFLLSFLVCRCSPLNSQPKTCQPKLRANRAPTTRAAAIETTVRGLGYALVEVERVAGGLLRVTIDHVYDAAAEERFITVDDCEKVTRQLQYVLDVEGLAYERLEVSSPGLDRPLKSEADFFRFSGERVDITLKEPFQGRKRFRGMLATHGGGWRVVLDAPTDARAKPGSKVAGKKAAPLPTASETATALQALDFAFDEVRDARLVPTIDFKGRRFAPPDSAAAPERAQDKMDGGLTR